MVVIEDAKISQRKTIYYLKSNSYIPNLRVACFFILNSLL